MKVYIQLGSNIGNDKFYEIISSISERSIILLVEPNKSLHPQLKYNYTNLLDKHEFVFIEKAVVPHQNHRSKLYTYNDTGKCSLIKRKSHTCRNGEISIEVMTFLELCDTYNIQQIELLMIDTEGLDYEILNSIDLSRVSIKKIIFEVWPYTNDDENSLFETGETFLNSNLKPKYNSYNWQIIDLDGNANYVLDKIH